jgi:hypothetical protein
VIPFLVYFALLIFGFAIQLSVVGVSYDDEDYKDLPKWVIMILATYRTAIGDL